MHEPWRQLHPSSQQRFKRKTPPSAGAAPPRKKITSHKRAQDISLLLPHLVQHSDGEKREVYSWKGVHAEDTKSPAGYGLFATQRIPPCTFLPYFGKVVHVDRKTQEKHLLSS